MHRPFIVPYAYVTGTALNFFLAAEQPGQMPAEPATEDFGGGYEDHAPAQVLLLRDSRRFLKCHAYNQSRRTLADTSRATRTLGEGEASRRTLAAAGEGSWKTLEEAETWTLAGGLIFDLNMKPMVVLMERNKKSYIFFARFGF